jgi:hypothetical protein
MESQIRKEIKQEGANIRAEMKGFKSELAGKYEEILSEMNSLMKTPSLPPKPSNIGDLHSLYGMVKFDVDESKEDFSEKIHEIWMDCSKDRSGKLSFPEMCDFARAYYNAIARDGILPEIDHIRLQQRFTDNKNLERQWKNYSEYNETSRTTVTWD